MSTNTPPLRLNILYLAAWYPDRFDNMYGLFIQKHAIATLPYCNISVLYVCADKKLKNKIYDLDYSVESGVNTLRIYFKKSDLFIIGKLINALRYWKSYLKGYDFLEQNSGQFNLAHVHVLTRCGIFALYLNKIKKLPYIITEHWSRYLPNNVSKGSYTGFLRRLFTKIVVRNAKAVTTVTENLANAMKALGLNNSNYYITPNVVDVQKFTPFINKNRNKLKRIVHVSCFDEKAKNIKGIINAVNNLAKSRTDFMLDIIGDGVDFKDVKQYADKTSLVGKTIFFEGLLTNEALINKMREADFFLLFSNYENLPCTIVESLALGVPVLATDVGGIKEHVNADRGVLIKPGDETELEVALKNMLDNFSNYDPESLRNYALKNFSFEEVGKKFYEIYMACLFSFRKN